MQARRVVLETDPSGRLVGVPELPGNRRIEAIFLILEDDVAPCRRRPHSGLSQKFQICGNVMESVPETDWNHYMQN